MAFDEHYICQRAANAIISEIGPYRVSTDALQSINQFLDEFIVILLTSAMSLDLSQIKVVVFALLPSTLGKNAIVEAELEVKTFTETESIDYELYERMRNLGSETTFPLEKAIPLLREKCFEYCTLADKDDQLYLQKSIQKRNEKNMQVIISPIVAIYVTTVMEHMAEYLLTAVAMTAEHEETDYVRVKEVFLALIDDIQLGHVFHRMELHDKMEKRSGLTNRGRISYMPPPSPTPQKKSFGHSNGNETGSFLDLTFDDMDIDCFDDNNQKNTLSAPRHLDVRPQSAMSLSSNYTLNAGNPNRKSTYHLFKNNRNSISGDIPREASPIGDNSSSVYDPDIPNMNFDDLIKSGGTVKVSLTPNRLRSIEIKDQTKEEPASAPAWERRSTSSPRLSTHASRPASPLTRQNTNSSNRGGRQVSVSRKKSNSSSTRRSSTEHHETGRSDHKVQEHSGTSIEVPKLHNRPQTPTSPLSKMSVVINDHTRFENPREAPLPPLGESINHHNQPLSSTSSPTMETDLSSKMSPKLKALSIKSSISSNDNQSLNKKISPILNPSKGSLSSPTISSTSSLSISSVISSVTSMPPPILSPSKSTTDNTNHLLLPEEPSSPKPTKVLPTKSLSTNHDYITHASPRVVIRRSSVSSRKSRENLRSRAKEEEKKSFVDEPMPLADNEIGGYEKKESDVSSIHSSIHTTSSDHSSESNRQVHFLPSEADSSENILNVPDDVERPSSIVAKRASTIGNTRRRSLHENYATEKYHQDVHLRQRVSNVGSVSVSIKQWDDILKTEESSVIPPAAHRRSLLRRLRQQNQQGEEEKAEPTKGVPTKLNSNAVLDKVLKFERASSLDDVAHQRVSHMPRRERFLYLQQDPSAIERKSTIPRKTVSTVQTKPRTVVGVDQSIQTEPIVEPKKEEEEKDDDSSVEGEHGLVDGDEEWFLQDDEWDDQEESAIVEWLLGE
ncbi:hypothetical protein BDB01DRAFT_851550 [Pilobolus umbonatus]|nr:hypothetical protein BDB01DRAFT_851550 [Pilobolus umbonatus]